jgi:5'-nucleotidase
MAQDLTYSGTVSAAFEAVIWHKPAIAFSYMDYTEQADYTAAAAIAQQIVAMKLYEKLPPLTLLNVNVPRLPLEEIKGFRIVRQGLRVYNDELITRLDPYGRPYYWIGGEPPAGDVAEVGTDIWATHEGYVSITPIHLDLTSHALMLEMSEWGIEAQQPGALPDGLVSGPEHGSSKSNGA